MGENTPPPDGWRPPRRPLKRHCGTFQFGLVCDCCGEYVTKSQPPPIEPHIGLGEN